MNVWKRERYDTMSKVRVRWEGSQFVWHSLAHVNREICLALLDVDGVELSLVPFQNDEFVPDAHSKLANLKSRVWAPLSGAADVHVRHLFPARFEVPLEGHLVVMYPWEFGRIPVHWIEPIRRHVREVWCYSRYVQEVYRASGIPESLLQLVPLGVDANVFQHTAPPYVFTTEAGVRSLDRRASVERPFTFLFVGGTIHRKGIDVLLEAYIRAFSCYDNVCLIIKDAGINTVYRDQNAREQILNIAHDESRPRLVYLSDDLPPHQLAGLYTAADCLVQPYRGEGFCLPALEAMACGIPVIVPDGGPTDDFVDETVGWRVAAQRRPTGHTRVSDWECAGPTSTLEIEIEDLAKTMRQVFSDPDEARRRGAEAAARVHGGFTWQHTRSKIVERLRALRDLPQEKRESKILKPERPYHDSSSGSLKLREKPGGGKTDVRALPTISLCMIVRDEERVLSACLESIKPWVDEIILVDTGSLDRTIEIAKQHGARIFHFPWCDDFSAARNESLAHANGAWILWMDADDTMPAECGAKLHELVSLAEDRITGFLMQVHIPPAPGEQGLTVVDHVKLFRNRAALRFTGRIHEQILEAIHKQGGRVERTDLFVVHSGYDYSPEGQIKKRERDLSILEKDLADRPGHPFVLFNIGMTAHHMKEHSKAIAAFEDCLARCQPQESIVRKAYAMLAGSYRAQGENERAVATVEKGLSLYPRDPELLFRSGIIYHAVGMPLQAEAAYQRLLTHRESGHIDSLDVSITGFKAHHNLALVYLDLERSAEAEAQFVAALRDNPQFEPSWSGLADLFERQGRQSEFCVLQQQLARTAPN